MPTEVPLTDIADMAPAARGQAWRSVAVDTYPSDAEAGDLDETLGPLALAAGASRRAVNAAFKP